jgi:DNA polymerase I-like protein with 3'-5' exonuclease and polymerase domains
MIRYTVDNARTAAAVLYELMGPPGEEPLVALDTETTGCNPKTDGPVGLARLWCMTLAWEQGDQIDAAFVTAEWVPAFRAWLESPDYKKVGQNIHGYDRHVLWNEGIDLRGIVGDTQRMSKLLDPRKQNHGLKDQARGLGIDMRDYASVFQTVWHGKGRVKSAPSTSVDFTRTGQEPIDVLWEAEWRRPSIVEYAVTDAVATLRVYRHLEQQLRAVRW